MKLSDLQFRFRCLRRHACETVILVLILIALAATAYAQNDVDSQTKCAIGGTVVDSVTGQPVGAAEVLAQRVPAGGGPNSQPASKRTDGGGRFMIDDLAPGRYLLQASHEGYTNQDQGHAKLGSRMLSLAPGQHIEDLVVSLTPGGAIAGHITNEAGMPLARASLRAMKYSYRNGVREFEEVAIASSNTRGEYRIAGLAAGKYYLRATGPHSSQIKSGTDKAYVPLYYPGSSDLTRAAELRVRPGEELAGIDLSYAPVHTMHIQGRVVDARTSLPSKGIEVTLLRDQGHTIFTPGQTSTDAAGRFEFSGVPPGAYVLVAELNSDTPQGRAMWGRTSVEVRDVNVEGVKVSVGPGVDVSGHIRVEGKTSLDVSELTAVLEPQESRALASLMPEIANASVKSDGTFVFHHVAEGTYGISIFPIPAGFYFGPGEGSDVLETGINIGRTHATPSLELILGPASAWIEGTVSNGDKPAAGVSVVLVPEGKLRNQPQYYKTSVSNRFGRFAIRSIVPGDYKLLAFEGIETGTFMDPDFLQEYEDRGQVVHVEEGGHANVEVEMISIKASR